MEVLVVCTGNIARSPMGEAMFRAKLDQVGAAATVRSAGFVTLDQPADEAGIEVMASAGLDIAGHRSQLVTPELVDRADLIVTMERAHVREIAVLDIDAFGRAFTLPDAARRALDAGPRLPAEGVREYVARLSQGRRPSDLLGHAPGDEIPDPHGRPVRAYRAAAEEIDRLSTTVVNHLVPAAHRSRPPTH